MLSLSPVADEKSDSNTRIIPDQEPRFDPLIYLECLKIVEQRDKLEKNNLTPVMLNEIMAVEDELGIDLPEQYENFLLQVGPGSEYGQLAYWYHLDLTRDGNLLQINQELQKRAKNRPRNPLKRFLAVYDPCDGSLVGFVRTNDGYKKEVFAWFEDERVLEPLAQDFCSFLQSNIDCTGTDYDLAVLKVENSHRQGMSVKANNLLRGS